MFRALLRVVLMLSLIGVILAAISSLAGWAPGPSMLSISGVALAVLLGAAAIVEAVEAAHTSMVDSLNEIDLSLSRTVESSTAQINSTLDGHRDRVVETTMQATRSLAKLLSDDRKRGEG